MTTPQCLNNNTNKTKQNKTKMKGLLITLGTVIILTVCVIAYYFSISNSEIALRNRYLKQEKVIEGFYDKMFKVIAQKAQISTEYKDSFKDIYKGLIEGRYSQGDGTLMKWIQEDNPKFDISLYSDLMASIEAERNGFFLVQTQIEDIELQHDNLLQMFPTSFIVGNREAIDYVPITSKIAKDVVETREDNDIDLFNSKK